MQRSAANRTSNLVWAAVIIVTVVLADQITKIWAMGALQPGQSVKVWGDFFMLTLVYNEGGALGTRLGGSTYYLIASSLILLFVLYYIWINARSRVISLTLAFVAAGALGNIIDRIRLGYVVDFLDFDFFDISVGGFTVQRWWAFNIADAAITCAIVFLVIRMLWPLEDAGGEAQEPSSEPGTR